MLEPLELPLPSPVSHPLLVSFFMLEPSMASSFLFTVIITLLLLLALKLIPISRRNPSRHPPGSLGLPFIGETVAFVAANMSNKGFYDFVWSRHLRHGSCFKTKIFGGVQVFVSTIESAKRVLSGGDAVEFSKRYIRSIAELLGWESLLCASHEHHRLVRQRIARLFTAESLASSVKLFDELTVKALSSWEQKGTVVVLDVALKITVNAICKMLISLEEEDELAELQKNVQEVSEAMLAFPLKFPGTRFYEGIKARDRIMKALRKKISLRRTGSEYHEDFLQSLLMSDDPLTDIQILDNILTLIIAGQVTTASAIAWMIKYLDENQEVQERVRVLQLELANKLPGSSLGLEALNEMSYASKVIKETLRVATIVTWFPRVALKDCEIEGFNIWKGWIVNVDARAIHFDPTIYDDPTRFNPSRFDEDPKPYSFFAFGTGGRTCLGMNIAKAMMAVFLHRLVTTYKWKVTDPDSSLEKWALFPRLRTGCPIHATPIESGHTFPCNTGSL